ncbi:cilia- and flagella-associated protein 276 isoform X1 [Gasterosteus aculeatus]|uniref:Uncharacterized protein n=1 Tax=Gasterosteus aculeatus aculeatus TaxID=481459 RepID=A0AAQ4PK34_GASAC
METVEPAVDLSPQVAPARRLEAWLHAERERRLISPRTSPRQRSRGAASVTRPPWPARDGVTSTSIALFISTSQDPKDSLDFQLESVYDHHKDVFWLKDQVSYQKETFSADLRKETSKQDMLEKETVNDIRVWVDPQRRSIHSIK